MGLLAFSQADPDVRWLMLGCSLARGAGDWMSDIDAAVGVVDEQLPGALPRARSAVDGLGELGEVGGQLSEGQRAVLPLAMGSFVLSDLRSAVTG